MSDKTAKLVIGIVVLLCITGGAVLQAQEENSTVPGNWRRSDPLSAIYLPPTSSVNDRCNQQVVGITSKTGAYLVTWTMASEESRPDQRVAISRQASQRGCDVKSGNRLPHSRAFGGIDKLSR